MKPSETTALYVEACRSRRLVPQEEEGRQWHKSFSHYEAKDVRAGLDAWTADTTPSKDGTPRGKWLPAPAELKPLVERIVQRRAESAAVKRYAVRLGCPTCRHTFLGFFAVDQEAKGNCRAAAAGGVACNTPLVILSDERPRS